MFKKGISRRRFLQSSLAGLAVTQMEGLHSQVRGTQLGVQSGFSEGEGLRVNMLLNTFWRFKRQAAPGGAIETEFVGAERSTYNDNEWERVTLPHTWDATPDNPFATTGHFRGIGWYRRSLEVPDVWRGRRVVMHFNGAFQVIDVWINGVHVGHHVNGYTSFAFEITESLECGKANLIAVKVDDVLNPFIAPAEERNVANYGGIYRSVWLEVINPVRICPNWPWLTFEGDEEQPVIRIRTRVINQSRSIRSIHLENRVVDAAGSTKVKVAVDGEIEPGQEAAFDEKTGVINDPELWSPDSPYLYSLVTTIFENDRAVDQVVTRFGIRFMRHDATHGFTLNGKEITLRGVNRRQDYGFLGDAVPEAIGNKDVRLMKEMGVNFFRTSHYPQDPVVLETCDELGILVWEEVPNLAVHIYPPPQDGYEPVYTTRFPSPLMDNLKLQLKEMISRDRNRPSIIIWGFADDLSGYQYPQDFVELSDYTHKLDPTRWTAGRCPHVTDIMDATTYPDLVQAHREHPEKMYIWNEWGAIPCERNREGPALLSQGSIMALSDSEMAQTQEGYLMQWNALPWLGTAKWCMFDCGEPNGSVTRTVWAPNDGKLTLRWPFNDYLGVSDMWRIPKNAYFFFQSQWTEKPMVHIVGHWTWPAFTGMQRQVRVYSNCDTVELFLNGKSMGSQKPITQDRVWQDFRLLIEKYHEPEQLSDQFARERLPGSHLQHPPFVWNDVAYQPGTLVAIGKKGNVKVQDRLRTAGPASAIILKSDKEFLVADGNDVAFIRADVIDRTGTQVPTAANWITFTAEGPGRLMGGATVIDAITGIAAINIQSTGEPGEIVISATSPGLSSALLRINAKRK